MREVKKYQHSKYPQHDESSASQQSSEEEQQDDELINEEVLRIQQQLKNMPYELILKQMQGGAEKSTSNNKRQANTPKIKKIAKKKHIQKTKHEKNEAFQVSIYERSRKKNAEIFEPKRKKAIDPRFQSYAGHYNSDLAMKSFNFIPKLQQAEINELKGKLKNKAKRGKLTPHQREILTNQYNRVTSDFKKGELVQLERQTKKQLKQSHGEGFHIKKNVFKHEFEKKKLENMSQTDREKKIKQKDTQMRRNQMNERRKTLNMNPHKRHFNK